MLDFIIVRKCYTKTSTTKTSDFDSYRKNIQFTFEILKAPTEMYNFDILVDYAP